MCPRMTGMDADVRCSGRERMSGQPSEGRLHAVRAMRSLSRVGPTGTHVSRRRKREAGRVKVLESGSMSCADEEEKPGK
jgi:hypothetical protein